MNLKEYEALRSQRGTELRNEVPNVASDLRIISAPVGLVRAGQEYLKRQREQAAPEKEIPVQK